MTDRARVEFWVTRICFCLIAVIVLAGFWRLAVSQIDIAKIHAEGKASSICFKSGGAMVEGECQWDKRIESLRFQVDMQAIQMRTIRAEADRCAERLHEERLVRNACSRVVAIETIDVEGSVRK